MLVRVDRDVCEHSFECVMAAPQIFKMNENGDLDYVGSPADSDVDLARLAEAGCPTGAITAAD